MEYNNEDEEYVNDDQPFDEDDGDEVVQIDSKSGAVTEQKIDPLGGQLISEP